MSKSIVITKMNTGGDDSVVCRVLDVKELTPNTEITVADKGVTALVTVNGVTRALTAGRATVYSLFNAAKDKKLFGGNKAYDKFEIFVVDQSSEFTAQWGFGKAEAIPCRSDGLGVDYAAVVTGKYSYAIKDCIGFKNSVALQNGELTCADLRELLRAKTSGAIRAFLVKALNSADFKTCQTRIGEYGEALTEELNKCLQSVGVTVYGLVIENMKTTIAEFGDRRDEITEKTLDNAVNKLTNDGLKDDISVSAMQASKVDIPLIYAVNGGQKNGKTFNCPKCGQTLEQGANYCSRCGENFLNKSRPE